jgi:hypothetical protein
MLFGGSLNGFSEAFQHVPHTYLIFTTDTAKRAIQSYHFDKVQKNPMECCPREVDVEGLNHEGRPIRESELGF